MFWIILTVLLSLLTITYHELGHVWAMRRFGVPIREISLLGIKLPHVPFLTFKYTFAGEKEPTAISIHPFLIGAYVQPNERAMRRLSPKDSAFVSGAGPYVNFLYCLTVYGLLSLTHPLGDREVLGAVCLIVASIMVVFRGFVCRYGVLALGTFLAGFLLFTLFSSPAGFSEGVGGPVTIVDQMSGVYQDGASIDNQFRTALLISVAISAMLGTTNALPLPPLDGGHMARVYLTAWNKKFGRYYNTVGFLLFVALVWTALSNDLMMATGL